MVNSKSRVDQQTIINSLLHWWLQQGDRELMDLSLQ